MSAWHSRAPKDQRWLKATLTSLLKRMAAKGLLTRESSDEDERRKRISLTAQGRRLRRRAEGVPAALAESTGMSVEEAVALKSLCETLHRCLTGGD